MRDLLCRLLGHDTEPGRPTPAGLYAGLGPFERCAPAESRGTLCTRCGRYTEHEWVRDARALTGREP